MSKKLLYGITFYNPDTEAFSVYNELYNTKKEARENAKYLRYCGYKKVTIIDLYYKTKK